MNNIVLCLIGLALGLGMYGIIQSMQETNAQLDEINSTLDGIYNS